MTIIGSDSFWMLWIIQFLFDAVILLTIILQKPARIEGGNERRGADIPSRD